MDREAWQAAVHGGARVGHDLMSKPTSNGLLSTVVQQQVVILEFLQEKISTRPSTVPSCTYKVISTILCVPKVT